MKELQASLSRNGKTSESLDLGEWDVSLGLERTIYFTNPNSYAKADLRGIKNNDKRVIIYVPDEILPLKTEAVTVKIAAKEFHDDIAEEEFFKKVIDKISGKVVWRTP